MSEQENVTPTYAELRALDAEIARRVFGLDPQKRWTQTSDNGDSLYLIPAGGRIERHGVLWESSWVAPRIYDGPVYDHYDEQSDIRTISPAGTVRRLDIYIYQNQHGEEDFEPLEDLSEEWVLVDDDDPNDGELVPRYSTNIAVAWQVAEWFRSHRRSVTIWNWCNTEQEPFGSWEVAITIGEPTGPRAFAKADTAPLAICRAALRAIGVER